MPSADYFQTKKFQKLFQEHYHSVKRFGFSLDLGSNCFKDYQQTTKIAGGRQRMKRTSDEVLIILLTF